VVEGYYRAVCTELKKLGYVFSKGAKELAREMDPFEHWQDANRSANGLLKDAGSSKRL
jgi:hypothetical protein